MPRLLKKEFTDKYAAPSGGGSRPVHAFQLEPLVPHVQGIIPTPYMATRVLLADWRRALHSAYPRVGVLESPEAFFEGLIGGCAGG
jgi:hypothetical protein